MDKDALIAYLFAEVQRTARSGELLLQQYREVRSLLDSTLGALHATEIENRRLQSRLEAAIDYSRELRQESDSDDRRKRVIPVR